ncbi:hypothetical protein BCR43DRAFT_494309 [Syncephalastrum racemosum]|uniref:ER membrane protein complex subunit 10 n=1 Tax=Syncephalastrum racemosum TaxID=13706 RepID=A0A1X2H7U8_SYNRA|nr:hypothetical protein BCR43DRAFT_494309 [Syncephalastrum racemosum]
MTQLNKPFWPCIPSLLLLFLWLCQFSLVTAQTVLPVYHKRGSDFIKRGEIVGLPDAPEFVPNPVSSAAEIVPQEDALYQLKIVHNDKTILQSVKFCQLISSNWQDTFHIHVDAHGDVYHVDYYAATDGACTADASTELPTSTMTTDVRVNQPVSAPLPQLGTVGGKNKQQQPQQQSKKQTQQQGAQTEHPDEGGEEEQSFVRKYWYLILAGVMLLLSSASPPPENARR